MNAHKDTYIYTHTCSHMYSYKFMQTHIDEYLHKYSYKFMCLRVHICIVCSYLFIYICIFTCTHIKKHMCSFMFIKHSYTYAFTDRCTCTCTLKYTYTYTCTYKYT